jgi:hypothetical protein
MSWIGRHIKWIMLVGGILTSTMFYAALAPQAALASNFGETLEGPLATLIVRNWGALVGTIGLMLIYGAFNPPVRPLVLLVAAASKAFFIALVLANGGRYLGYQAGTAVVVDTIMVVVFGWYLVAARASSASGPSRRAATSRASPS